jgi:hypothetical protein
MPFCTCHFLVESLIRAVLTGNRSIKADLETFLRPFIINVNYLPWRPQGLQQRYLADLTHLRITHIKLWISRVRVKTKQSMHRDPVSFHRLADIFQELFPVSLAFVYIHTRVSAIHHVIQTTRKFYS